MAIFHEMGYFSKWPEEKIKKMMKTGMDGIWMEYGWNMDGIWMEWGTMRPNLFQKPRGTRPVFADPAKAGKESAKGDHGGPQGWMGGNYSSSTNKIYVMLLSVKLT